MSTTFTTEASGADTRTLSGPVFGRGTFPNTGTLKDADALATSFKVLSRRKKTLGRGLARDHPVGRPARYPDHETRYPRGAFRAPPARAYTQTVSQKSYNPRTFPEVTRWLRPCTTCAVIGYLPKVDDPSFTDNRWRPMIRSSGPALTDSGLCEQCAAVLGND